jgi:hypothetical protein
MNIIITEKINFVMDRKCKQNSKGMRAAYFTVSLTLTFLFIK